MNMTFLKRNLKGQFIKNIIPWNEGTKGICKANSGSFKKGISPWIKGRKHSRLSKKKMSISAFEGGRTKRLGYILIFKPKHPKAIGGYIREHRLIMERYLGRYLRDEERVHHINGIKDDNQISNLLLLPNESAHRRLHNDIRRKKKDSILCR